MEEERKLPVKIVRKEVELPGFEGWWAEFSTDVTVDEIDALDKATDLPEMKRILAKYITAWNFVDKHGKPLPKPSAKSIGKLTPLLLIWCCVALVRACMEDVPFPKTLREGRSRS